MPSIKILPEGLIDRIAAGEVIENPASVVKELVENAIDANSGSIEVSIKGGGKDEILIIDDGDGIPKDQVELAFLRHATSKIKSWNDLLITQTMGFRGEALPSISSVSMTELTTCYKDEAVGSIIKFEAGKQTHFGPSPPKKGCRFQVRNLFYNVPARRKFLKSESSEKRRISEILRRYVIANYDKGFKCVFDSKIAADYLPEKSLLQRLSDVWGANIAKDLIKLKFEKQGPVEISGYISNLECSRGNRSEIYFFVNQRPVLEKSMFSALAAALMHKLPSGRFPYAAIFLNIDPNFVDINVHPAKTEVRFADERFIFNIVKKAVEDSIDIPVALQLTGRIAANNDRRAIPFEEAKQRIFQDLESRDKSYSEAIDSDISASDDLPESSKTGDIISTMQIFKTYLLIRFEEKLLILDQHTAHERVLFENNLNSLANQNSPSQKLLFDEIINLTPLEMEVYNEIEEDLAKTGFEARSFGPGDVIISGVPQELSSYGPIKAFKNLLKDYVDYKKDGFESRWALAAALACKAAVKAGQLMSDQQIRGLYQSLLKCDEPYRCPHGRPTMATLNYDDLEKIFKRK